MASAESHGVGIYEAIHTSYLLMGLAVYISTMQVYFIKEMKVVHEMHKVATLLLMDYVNIYSLVLSMCGRIYVEYS